MNPPRVYFVLMATILIGSAAPLFWPAPSEPTYDGRKLSEWLKMWDENTVSRPPGKWGKDVRVAEHAVRCIGTNAIPFLLRWNKLYDVGWRWPVASAMDRASFLSNGPGFRLFLKSRFQRGRCAQVGFQILGEEGSPAVPELIRQLRTSKDPLVRASAMSCLGCVGNAASPAIPFITPFINSTNFPEHWCARGALCNLAPELVPDRQDNVILF
jgi:hypothetical protein